MKKILLPITTLILFFITSGVLVAAPQDNGEVPLKETPPPPGDRPRDVGNPLITCYLVRDYIVIYAGGVAVSANVVIENRTNGHIVSYNTLFSIMPIQFPLFGDGVYFITIVLPSGAIFEGSFII